MKYPSIYCFDDLFYPREFVFTLFFELIDYIWLYYTVKFNLIWVAIVPKYTVILLKQWLFDTIYYIQIDTIYTITNFMKFNFTFNLYPTKRDH